MGVSGMTDVVRTRIKKFSIDPVDGIDPMVAALKTTGSGIQAGCQMMNAMAQFGETMKEFRYYIDKEKLETLFSL